MTYDVLKDLTTGLLIGDNVLPKDDAVLHALVKYSLYTVATQANSIHLTTLNADNVDILRLTTNNYVIRKPHIPTLNEDDVDIEEELCMAVARYLASYISKDKGGIHVNAAKRIILDFNATVSDMNESSSVLQLDTVCNV